MATEQGGTSTDEQLAAAEAEHVERLAQAHEALAAAQDRAYWLDRWGVDLNALMQRPGADELRRGLRAARTVWRRIVMLRRRSVGLTGRLRGNGSTTVPAPPKQSVYERSVSPDRLRTSVVTERLCERLDPADLAAVEAAADAEQRQTLDGADPVGRRRLLLNLGVHHRVPAILDKTALTPDMPPEDVHAMARGAGAAGGSLYYADLMIDGLRANGFEPAAGTRILDFGCSSGRAVRVLAAAYPEAEWHGCDPIGVAIEWAREHIEGVEFLHSPERPPLPYADGFLDAAYAISIWSHFNAPAARAWLAEMRRLIRPGGTLVVTTHGMQTIPHDRGVGARGEPQLAEIEAALDRDGFWFKDEFGTGGDHGVVDVDWGTAFMTAEWLLATVTPEWKVVAFAPGRVEENQDLYVLERV